MDDEHIKAKIAALLSEEGRSEAEATTARAAAAKLMAKHGLTEEDVRQGAATVYVHDSDELGRAAWVIAKWIIVTIGELTGAKPWTSKIRSAAGKPTDRKEVHWAGPKASVELASWLLGHVIEQGRQAARTYGGDTRTREDLMTAYGHRVHERIKALVKSVEIERVESGSTALVVARDREVDNFIASLGVALKTSKSVGRRLTERGAIEAGRAAGDRATLSRPVGRSGGVLRIGS